MTQVVGGRRERYIHDSVEAAVRDILTQLHWLDAGRQHKPIKLVAKPNKWDDPIDLNSIVVDTGTVDDAEAEMGSNLTNDTYTVWVDFYAEKDNLGRDVAGDLFNAFRGKMPSIGRGRMKIDVFDYSDPAQPAIFYCTIENVVQDKAHNFPHPWQQHWFSVRFDLIDTFGDEYDQTLVPGGGLPGPDTLPSA